MRTITDLQQKQALPLETKILLTRERVRQWVHEFGEDGCYISFSGGKDSTVLLDLIRNKFNYNIDAVYVDTGLEYPETRNFVKECQNITWLRPKMTFKKVIQEYGYPLFSKENSLYISQCQNPTERNETSRNLRLNGIRSDGVKVKVGVIPNSLKFAVYAPFKISNRCCDIMKKAPLKKYSKEKNAFPFTAEMATESSIRARQWLKHGCNGFDLKMPKSMPLAFWTEQDILQYIYENNLKIAEIYGNVIRQEDKYILTGVKRTGCMFCGYGCHLEKQGSGRFELMKKTHPLQYEYIMKSFENGGLNYKNVIDWINNNSNLYIKY